MVDAGVPTAKAFMVFDFRLADRAIFDAMRDPRGARRDARGPLRGSGPDRRRGRFSACSMVIRHHVTTLPRDRPRPRRWRPTGRWRSPGRPTRRSTSSTCRAPPRSATSPRRGRRGVRATAETCPHYLALTDARYDEPDPLECAKSVISPPLRPAADRDALWAGLAAGELSLDRHRPRPGSGRGREGRGRPRRLVRPDQQRRARDRDAARRSSTARASRGAGSRSSGWSTSWRRPRPAGSAWTRKGAIEVGRDADLVLFDPAARRTIRRPTSTTRATSRRTRASRSPAPSGASSSAAAPSSGTGLRWATAAWGGSSSEAGPVATEARPAT